MLLDTLRTLEIELHQPPVRRCPARLTELLHPEFREYGRSGAHYTRNEILESLPAEQGATVIWSQDFELIELTDGLAVLTYRSAHVDRREWEASLSCQPVFSVGVLKRGG